MPVPVTGFIAEELFSRLDAAPVMEVRPGVSKGKVKEGDRVCPVLSLIVLDKFQSKDRGFPCTPIQASRNI